jgi:hypothetical protein
MGEKIPSWAEAWAWVRQRQRQGREGVRAGRAACVPLGLWLELGRKSTRRWRWKWNEDENYEPGQRTRTRMITEDLTEATNGGTQIERMICPDGVRKGS